MRGFAQLARGVGVACEYAAALLLAAIVAVVFTSFASRYLFQIAISWPEEVARFIAVWLTLVGAAAAAARGEQISVDLLVRLVPARWTRVVRLVVCLASIAAIAVLMWGTVPLFFSFSAWSTFPGSGIARIWLYTALPVGGMALFVQLLGDLAALIRGEPSSPGPESQRG